MEFKYIRNFDQSEATADMYVYAEIGGDYGVYGQPFVNEINYLVKEMGVKTLNIRINSPGGDVFEAYSIFAAINKCGVKTRSYIDGCAASCAGWIALAANEIYMAPHGKIMIHAPYIDGEMSENDKKGLEAIKDQIISIFENRTGMTRAMVETMMEGDTWLNAAECIELKIADGIDEYTPRTMPVNTLAKILNKQITETNMKQVINHLKLADNATEVEVLAKVKELESERDQYKNKAETAEAKEKELTKAVAEQAVDADIAAGKFAATDREKLIDQATNNLDAYKSLSASIPVKSASVSEAINRAKADAGKGGNVEDRTNWNFMDWLKKDRKGLEAMEKERPEEFQKLRNSYKPSAKK